MPVLIMGGPTVEKVDVVPSKELDHYTAYIKLDDLAEVQYDFYANTLGSIQSGTYTYLDKDENIVTKNELKSLNSIPISGQHIGYIMRQLNSMYSEKLVINKII